MKRAARCDGRTQRGSSAQARWQSRSSKRCVSITGILTSSSRSVRPSLQTLCSSSTQHRGKRSNATQKTQKPKPRWHRRAGGKERRGEMSAAPRATEQSELVRSLTCCRSVHVRCLLSSVTPSPRWQPSARPPRRSPSPPRPLHAQLSPAIDDCAPFAAAAYGAVLARAVRAGNRSARCRRQTQSR